ALSLRDALPLSAHRDRRRDRAPLPPPLLPAAPRSGRVPPVGIPALATVGCGMDIVVRLFRQGDPGGHPPRRGCAGRGAAPLRLPLPPDRRRVPAAPH